MRYGIVTSFDSIHDYVDMVWLAETMAGTVFSCGTTSVPGRWMCLTRGWRWVRWRWRMGCGYSRVNTDQPARKIRCEKLDECLEILELAWMGEHRDPSLPFDIVVEGVTDGNDPNAARARMIALADAGATWWIESRWDDTESADTLRTRTTQGPPRI